MCIYIYVCVYIYICMYVYIYIYICVQPIFWLSFQVSCHLTLKTKKKTHQRVPPSAAGLPWYAIPTGPFRISPLFGIDCLCYEVTRSLQTIFRRAGKQAHGRCSEASRKHSGVAFPTGGVVSLYKTCTPQKDRTLIH